jgi:hypothetical protein
VWTAAFCSTNRTATRFGSSHTSCNWQSTEAQSAQMRQQVSTLGRCSFNEHRPPESPSATDHGINTKLRSHARSVTPPTEGNESVY